MIEVGTIFTYAFHYNCRRPQFVRVVRSTEKSVWIESLPKMWHTHDGYGQNGTEVPNLSGEPTKINGSFRIKDYNGNPYFKINGCYAFIWDGTPEDSYSD